ncbi:MAG: hypothetical protein H3C26_00015 [Rhodocyclaceae bacterium]|nr:hypothetical protein [Rhodocyclaceae bacterium]
MKRLAAVIVVLLLVAVGFFGYTKYQERQLVEAVRPHVKNTSLRIENFARLKTDKSNITYKEFFSKVDSDLAELDKRLLDVQTLSTATNKETTDIAASYIRTAQDFIRAMGAMTQKDLSVNAAKNWASQSIDDLRTSTSYSYQHAKRTSDKAVEDFRKAIDEYKEAEEEMKAAASKMKEAAIFAGAKLDKEMVISPEAMDSFLDAHSSEK